jgi:hypothetical protein
MSDVAGMLEDDEHMRSSYRLREVASWLRLPYDEQRKPKRHTTARAHDTARFGGELWLLRVPADLDLNLLNGASFVDADLDGETEITLAPDVARSAVQIDNQDGAASTRLVLSARPQEVTQAFKCAFPSVLRVRDAVDDGDDNDGGDAAAGNVRTINHLKFGAAFDRAFTVHRWSAPVSQTTTLNPVYDDAFLDNRARVQPVEASALKHKFLPIGASTATNVVAERDSRRTTKESSSSTATTAATTEKEKKKERKKEKKQHRESEESHKSKKSTTSSSSSKHKK